MGLRPAAVAPPPPAPPERPVTTVTALGRLEPISELRTIAAPMGAAGQPTLRQVLVSRGDPVKAGQLLAVLDNQPQLEAAVAAARAEVNLARSQLAIARADAGSGEASQRARVRSLEAQQRTAATEARRYQSLYASGAVSAEERDARQLSLDTLTASLQEARVLLARQQARSSAGSGGTDLDVEAAQRSLEQPRRTCSGPSPPATTTSSIPPSMAPCCRCSPAPVKRPAATASSRSARSRGSRWWPRCTRATCRG